MKTLNQGQVSGFGLEKNQVFEKITFCAELDSQRSGSSKNKLVETFTMKFKKKRVINESLGKNRMKFNN